MAKISIITQESENEGKAALPKFGKKIKDSEVDTGIIKTNMEKFLNDIDPILNTKKDVGEFEIDEIELNLTISASGGIQIIGKIEAGIQGGITLKLKRKRCQETNT